MSLNLRATNGPDLAVGFTQNSNVKVWPRNPGRSGISM